jgi:hypothetical protein
MNRRLLLLLPILACSNAGDSLNGSVSQVYDLSFNSITITQYDQQVQIEYVGDNGDPAVLTVNISDLSPISGSSINLVSMVPGTQQFRGVLQNVGTVTKELDIEIGSVVFNQVPTVGSSLSGSFSTTLSDPAGYTLDGTFSGTVNAP